MKPSADLEEIAKDLLAREDLQVIKCRPLQSLWAGYGHICRIEVVAAASSTSLSSRPLILKYIQPPTRIKYRDAELPDEGHVRKVLSYQIEQHFYTNLAPQMPSSIGVASSISSINALKDGTHTTAMIMTDLQERYPCAGEKRQQLSDTQTYAALKWLGDFHGFWWTKAHELRKAEMIPPPLEYFAKTQNAVLMEPGVWLNGGYTYLATRRSEYASLLESSDSEWSSALCSPIDAGGLSVAELVAIYLAPVPKISTIMTSEEQDISTDSSRFYQTLLHGDVKSENLFTSVEGDLVAFYDFQYVGFGLGVRDLAKFFTCSVPLSLLLEDSDNVYMEQRLSMQQGEKSLLEKYLLHVNEISGRDYEWETFVRHWETALVDWLRFQASWGFWGNTEWLEARTRSILADKAWSRWLKKAVAG